MSKIGTNQMAVNAQKAQQQIQKTNDQNYGKALHWSTH